MRHNTSLFEQNGKVEFCFGDFDLSKLKLPLKEFCARILEEL